MRRVIPKAWWRPIAREDAKRFSAIAREMLAGHEEAKPAVVTGRQVLTARAALGLSAASLGERADVPVMAVERFEGFGEVDRHHHERLLQTLEMSGVAFVADGDLAGVFFHVA